MDSYNHLSRAKFKLDGITELLYDVRLRIGGAGGSFELFRLTTKLRDEIQEVKLLIDRHQENTKS